MLFMEEGHRWDALLTVYERHLGAKEGRGGWKGGGRGVR